LETVTLVHEVFLPATAHEVFDAFMDPQRHAAMTGSPASIDRKIGGAFSVCAGAITGTTTALTPDREIVQDWRGKDWPAGHLSTLTLSLSPAYQGRGVQLSMQHAGVPAAMAAKISQGWRDFYWNRLADYLRDAKIAPVRRFMEEFKNHANIDVVDQTWTADCVLHVPGFATQAGREAQKSVGRAIFEAFGEVHVEIIDTIVEGDRVVERHKATAVSKGPFMGFAATGKPVFWTENHIYRLRDGLIAETWSEVSFHDLVLNQLQPAKVDA
jgi:predicted ester cyclase/uncharacterized protein YndB with AHSA1/START domain